MLAREIVWPGNFYGRKLPIDVGWIVVIFLVHLHFFSDVIFSKPKFYLLHLGITINYLEVPALLHLIVF
jgi:hypothetical protein